MKQIVAYYWGLLWHNLEIELMRVGEPIIGVVELTTPYPMSTGVSRE